VLRELIAEAILGPHGLQLDEPMLANERQRALVEEACRATSAARAGLVPPPGESTLSENEGLLPEELIAEELRRAIGALGRVTGEELVPDLLDEVFRRFCIGK
jgi:tRNA U34 5-carboxymethylaminomethyl modifying GTPase MnmE/TrmE